VSLVKTILDRATKLQDDLTGAGEMSPALRRSQFLALSDTVWTLLTIGDTQGAHLARDKGNAEAQRNLAVSLWKIGDVKLWMGDGAGALAAYEESLAIRRDLAKDKSNARAQRDLSISLEKIGDIKLRAGDAAGALTA
jgi:hypothetical protein